MITFNFKQVIAEGPVSIDEKTGMARQNCTIITSIDGFKIGERLLTDAVSFEVDASLPIINAWEEIQKKLAPEWVADNYSTK